MADGYRIGVMARDDVAQAVDWAAGEGWNPGAQDIDAFRAVDPEGFIGGWLDGRLIASISVVNYDAAFAFLGCYIVAPEFRGRGYGLRLWREAVRHAGGRVIGLDGVVAEQENYATSGFRLAYRNIRMGGMPVAIKSAEEVEIAPLTGLSPELEQLDRQAFPSARTAFLSRWLSAPGHLALGAHRDGTLVGYGVIRPCRIGHKIGPLFATDPETARELAAALIDARAPDGGEVFLDVPEANTEAMRLGQDLGLSPVFETARMYSGPVPTVDLDRVYGVTSFELG